MRDAADSRPVIIAALPREIGGLVKGWRFDEGLRSRGIYLFWSDDAVIACAGMGAQRAGLAVEAALRLGPATELISAGWAGACIHRLAVGDVVMPDVVVDVKTGERFFSEHQRGPTDGLEVLATAPGPASPAEKERLSRSYDASLVDMEAATVARIARAQGIPFRAVKAVSDGASFALPDVSRFTTREGHLREASFGLHVALRPRMWRPVAAMARGSRLASGRLQSAIREVIFESRKSRA